MKTVAVIGWRDFLTTWEGIGKHCREIYTRLAKNGWEIFVFIKKSSMIPIKDESCLGLHLVPIFTIESKRLEPLIYSFLTLLWLIFNTKIKIDIVHIHTIGSCILLPILKLLKYKVVVTHHGPDYVRKKWRFTEKLLLKLNELIAIKFADEIICIAAWLKTYLEKKFNRYIHFIPNGIGKSQKVSTEFLIKRYNLSPGRYFLSVGEFAPEKGLHNIITAFNRIKDKKGWKLVLAGKISYSTKYYNMLKQSVEKNPDIIFLQDLSSYEYEELYSHTGVFIVASSYECLPVQLIEAMSYGLPVIATSIEANIVVGKEYCYYFSPEDTDTLTYFLEKSVNGKLLYNPVSKELLKDYNWDEIALHTEQVYKNVIG